jgi:hypothetical protein
MLCLYIEEAGDSLVGIAIRYALSFPGIAYRSDEILLTTIPNSLPGPALGPRVRGLFPGGKVVRACLGPRLKKE